MALDKELAAVEAEIARLETIRDWLRTHTNHAGPRRQRKPGGRVTAADAAVKVLSAHDGPMQIRDLTAAARKAGAKISDAEGLTKALTRFPDRFRKVGRGMWELR